MKQTKPVMTVYACGGTGIGIVSPILAKAPPAPEAGFADTRFLLADTSMSNLKTPLEQEYFHYVEDPDKKNTDGSGQVRTTNVNAARGAVSAILLRQPPGDISVVVSSAFGGSGPVIAAMIIKELMSQGKAVVSILIGAENTHRVATNTLACLGTFDNFTRQYGMPLQVHYIDSNGLSRLEYENAARHMLFMLSVFYSGENEGLDRQDLYNFLNYHQVGGQHALSLKPALTSIGYSDGDIPPLERGQHVSSMVSILKDVTQSHVTAVDTPSHVFGYAPDALLTNSLKLTYPLHLYTVQGFFHGVVEQLKERVQELTQRQTVQVGTITHGLSSDDDGFIG